MLMFLIYGCAHFEIRQPSDISEIKLNQHPYKLGTTPAIKEGPDGQLFLGYYSDDGGLYIKKISNMEETRLATETGEGSFVDISFLKNKMFITWRPKLGDGSKYIYVQSSVDGGKSFSSPLILNTSKDALLPVSVDSDGEDCLYVIWLDEREKNQYRLYMNYTKDGGKTFLEKDVDITPDFEAAALPSIKVRGEKVDIFFAGKESPEMPFYFYHKYSSDGGITWSENRRLKRLGEWMPFTLKPILSDDGSIALLWAGVEGIEGLYTSDGKEWQDVAFPYTKGKDVNRLEFVNKGKDVYMVTSWKTRGHQYEKAHVYFLKSGDGGKTWSDLVRLNKNEYDNTSAWFPTIRMGSDGQTILAVWQDHRNIRGNIYINFSRDGGKTWLSKDLAIEKSMCNNSWYPMLYVQGSTFYTVWIRYADDSLVKGADIYLHPVRIDKIAREKEQEAIGQGERERLLRERVMKMWAAQVEGDRNAMYDLYDPFFRARLDRDPYKEQKLHAKYYNPEITSIDIKGNIAEVGVKVEYELSGIVMMGRPVKEPRKETITNEIWLFMDGTWFREFVEYITESRIAIY